MEENVYCSYYGRLEGERYGYNIGESMIDQMCKDMIAKHERILVEKHNKILEKLKAVISYNINKYHRTLIDLHERLLKIEQPRYPRDFKYIKELRDEVKAKIDYCKEIEVNHEPERE